MNKISTLSYSIILLLLLSFSFSNAQTITYPGNTPAGFCQGGNILLTASNPPAGASFVWEKSTLATGPWSIVGTNSPTLTVNTIGYYRVTVSTIAPPSSIMYDSVQVVENLNPIPSFTSAPTNQCGTVPVLFTNNTTGAASYAWNFGDVPSGANNTSTALNPVHRFVGIPGNATQNFTVTQTATSSQGCVASTTRTVTTTQLPDASLNGNGFSVVNGIKYFKKCTNTGTEIFSFQNISTTLATNTNYQIIWGDASPDYISTTFPTTLTLTHSYSIGLTPLMFIVTGQNGCKDTTTYNVFLGNNPSIGLGNPGNTAICTNSALTFPLSSTATNTAGTTYTVSFSDGTPNLTFSQPPPLSVTHNFNSTSCGVNTTPSYPNAFAVVIVASNPCASSQATVVPIYVSQKPTPAMNISPKDTICLATAVTVTNTSGLSASNDNGSCTPGKQIWRISPATGWVLNAGTFGNDLGQTDPALWINGSPSLNLSFTAVGTYTIKMIIGNTFCGIDSIVKTICVNPNPLANFTIDNLTGCTPLTVNTTNNSNTPFCGTNQYLWTVNYTPTAGCTPATALFNYLNGTNANSTNPQFQFINPGTYTIDLRTITPGGACTSAVVTKTVIVKAKPIVNIAPFATACQNAVLTPTAVTSCNLTGATTYLWTFPSGTPSTAGTAIPGTVIFSTNGTYTISLDVTNECGTTTATQPITINPQPDFSAPPNISFCAGETTTAYSLVSTPPGATFTWTNSNTAIGLAASGNTSIPAFTATNNTTAPITGTVNITALQGGCTRTRSFVITVNPRPLAPVVTSPINYCQNETATSLSATASAGNTLLWYTTATGGTGSTTAPVPSTSSIGATSYYVSQISTAYNCESPRVAIVVNVNAIPVIANLNSTQPTACGVSDGTISFSVPNASTSYIVKYLKNGVPFTVTLTSSASSIITITNLGVGVYSDIFVTQNLCASNLLGPVTLSNPNPPATPIIANVNPICSGSNLSLSASSTTAGASFTWSGPLSFTSTLANPVIPNTTIANAGTYSVVATLAGCSSAAATVVVVIDQTPISPIVNNNGPLCAGGTLNLTANSTTPGVTYAWTGVGGYTSSLQNPSITNATVAMSGIYAVVATNTTATQSCPSAQVSTTVLIKPVPKIIDSSATNPTACASATGTILLNGLAANTNYLVNYSFNTIAQPTLNLISSGTGMITINALLAGTYSNITVTLNGCISNVAGPFTLVNPNPPITPLATNNGALCVGYNLQLNATTTSAGIASYAWVGPNGFTSTLQNPTLPNITAANAGQYSVTVTINNCTSAAGTTSLVVNPLAVLPTVTSPITYCLNAPTVALTASATSGHTLNWYTTLSGGTALTSAPTPSSALAGTTNYFVSQTTSLGCEGARATIQVIIHPNAKALFIPTDTIKCAPFNITPAIVGLQQYPQNNSIYQWYANNTLIGTGINFPGYTILNQNDSVEIKLKTISLFGCKDDSIGIKFFTYKVPAPFFTLSDTVGCGPLSVNFVNATPDINLYNYNWNFGNGITSTLQQPGTIIFATNPTFTDTTYLVKLTVSSVCNAIVFQKSIRVKSKPKALYTADRTSGCSPMRVLFTNTSKGLNNTYYWEFDDGSPTFITTSSASFTHTFNTGIVTNYNVRLIAENECGRDTIIHTLTVAPNNIQLLYSINGPDRYGCAPHTVAFFNNSNGASSFQWNFGDGNTLATSQNVQTVFHTYLTAGDYTVTLTAANNCTDTFALQQITVYPKPTAAFNTSVSNACIGQSIQMNNTSSSATSYLWNFGDNTANSNLINPTHTYTTPGLYTIQLIIYRVNPSGNVCTDTTTRQVQITATLPGNFTQTAVSGNCAPLTVTFVNQIRPSVTAIWNFGDGNTATGDSVVHTYLTAGLFNVSLTVTVAGGCTYIKNSTVNLLGPNGTLQYTHPYVCYPGAATFTASASNTNNFIWNFGDGNTQTTTQNIVTHNYANPGVYVPTVTLQNAAGCNVSIIGIDTIKVDKITKGFKSAQQNNCGNTVVNFTDTSFAYFGKALVKWRFGDGGIGNGSLISHTYTASGSYNVEMIVIGNSGCTDTTRKTIFVQVNNNPITSINAPIIKCVNDSVLYQSNVISTDQLNPFQWKILPNGATFNGTNFTTVFNIAGTYTVRLIAGTVNGCFDTAFHTITINTTPTVTTSAGLNLCKGNTTQLNAFGASTYQWTPTSGLSCTTCPNPLANPITTTAYTVTGTNGIGCSSSKSLIVTVIQPTHITVSPNVKICIGQSANLLAVGASNYLWDNAATLSSTTIANPVATPTITTVYRVIGFDSYNCFADTAYVQVGVGNYPTVRLGNDVTLATGTNFPLNSSITNGPIVQWLWTPVTDLSCSTCSLPIATVRKDITYRVNVTTDYGCSASDTINIKTFCESAQVFIPKAFTPDGDGLNDILMVRGTGIASVKYFRIFNRWGELIFERNNFAPNDSRFGWDGKIRGVVGPPDVFVYTAEVICENGSTYIYKGNTTSLK